MRRTSDGVTPAVAVFERGGGYAMQASEETRSGEVRPVLQGRRALVIGIANEHSIAYGCASAFRRLGAELAITYLNERAKSHVKPLADELQAAIVMPLDVSVPGQLEAVFDTVASQWARLDILVHSI